MIVCSKLISHFFPKAVFFANRVSKCFLCANRKPWVPKNSARAKRWSRWVPFRLERLAPGEPSHVAPMWIHTNNAWHGCMVSRMWIHGCMDVKIVSFNGFYVKIADSRQQNPSTGSCRCSVQWHRSLQNKRRNEALSRQIPRSHSWNQQSMQESMINP